MTLVFGDTNPATSFFMALRKERMVFVGIEYLFIPVEVEEWRDVRTLTGGYFKRGEAIECG